MGLMLRIMTVYKVQILRIARSNQEHIHHSVHVSLLSRTVLLKNVLYNIQSISRECDFTPNCGYYVIYDFCFNPRINGHLYLQAYWSCSLEIYVYIFCCAFSTASENELYLTLYSVCIANMFQYSYCV